MGSACGKESQPEADSSAPVLTQPEPNSPSEKPTQGHSSPQPNSQQNRSSFLAANKTASPQAGSKHHKTHHRTLTDLYKHCKYQNADQLKALGTYPVADIWDHFIRGEVLGKGGYGEVVIVQKKSLDQMDDQIEIKEIDNSEEKFAMKSITQIRKEKSTFPAFENEVRVHQRLRDPNIVQFIASFVSLENYHMITELCTGGEVFDRVVSHKRFSEHVASKIVRQMLLALKHCHDRNIVHRDLKPSNFVFATRKGDILDQPVKLIDFGLAKEVDPETVYTDKVGTPFYVSPETIDSHHPHYNVRNGEILKSGDMWAIGAIVFVLITGKLPFPGRKHKDIFRNITKCRFKFPETLLLSESVKDFIHSLLQIDPTKRFTCEQALSHPWIVHEDQNDDPLHEMVLSGLSSLQRQNKLQRAVARIAINHLTDKDIAMLQDLFATYDKDRSGQIEIPELIQMLKDSGFDADAAEQEALLLMEELDSNKDGALTMVEFAQVAARPRVSISRTIVKRTFDSMDMDGDGRINALELKESLGDMIDDNYIEKIFRNVDTNQDGMLTFEEFLEAMRVTIKTRREKTKPQRKSVFELNFSADPNAPPPLAPLEHKSPHTSSKPKPVQEDEDGLQVTEDNLN
eukprot:TRINITY_DN8775_c0_g1_i1.p1 TRINITY_DN8775_c0_g1~~TRINITY_DN8775_c0_g1_i1.p1  ORF type:complete len:629 (-),score=164.99 TRINITY_DN8775_c0_g1_i1:130-2016(-)